MTTTQINTAGLEALHTYLNANHKQFVATPITDSQLYAWAAEAEQNANDGNGCYIELKAHEHISGHVTIFDMPANGFDVVALED